MNLISFLKVLFSLEVKKMNWRLIILVVYSQCASQRASIIACAQKMKKMLFPWIRQTRSRCGGSFNDPLHVRAVSSSHPVSGKANQIALDSGADVSLLPRNMRYAGQSFRSALSNMRISDAQGSRIRDDDERVVTLEFTGHNGTPVQTTENFWLQM